MNKQALITAVTEKTNLARSDVEAAVTAFTDIIMSELADGRKVKIVGFGAFECRRRVGRIGINPRTGEKMEIAEVVVPHFKAGSVFKAAVK